MICVADTNTSLFDASDQAAEGMEAAAERAQPLGERRRRHVPQVCLSIKYNA